jgi:hypothetical protein
VKILEDKDKNLFSDSDIDALLKLVDIFEDSNGKRKIYKISEQTGDSLSHIILKSKKYTNEEKRKLLKRFSTRNRNQEKIEAVSMTAEDIKRGKDILDGNIRPKGITF